MTTMTHRPTEAICPPWCQGHEGKYQMWEPVDGRPERGHDSEVSEFHDVEVCISQAEAEMYGTRVMQTPYVSIHVNRRGLLTPTEARLMAQTLTDLADRIEATR